ncbi:MAG: molybdopterin cofactor-binding domain-containing protein [Planctomycetota bacterium]
MSPPPRGLAAVSRRQLLAAGMGSAAALAVGLYGGYRLGKRAERPRRVPPPDRQQPLAPNAFVAIDEQGVVTIWLAQAEVGQGVATSLPVSIADELGADAAHVRLVLAPAHESYGRQFTAVSSSVKDNWVALRRAGAAVREMLVRAFATALDAPVDECVTRAGYAVHEPSGRRAAFGVLVRAASRLPVPQTAALKQPVSFDYIGKAMPRLDHAAKVDGTARYGVDVRLPGMAFAVVARCATYGGRAASFDDSNARRVAGVLDVFRIDSGICVIATSSYAAIKGRQALACVWDHGGNRDGNSEQVQERMRKQLAAADDPGNPDDPGATARRDGRGRDALADAPANKPAGARAPRLLRADYELPYLAHATLEPMNCTADVRADGCTILVPTQVPQNVRNESAALLGMKPEQVVVQPTWIGGAFGRRVHQDFVHEALWASRQAKRPVQVLWTREDDFAHDHYRPCSRHRLAATLDGDGLPTAWHHRIAAPSILAQDPNFAEPVDPIAVEGADTMPYGIPHVQVDLHKIDAPFPLGFWRSVGHSYNAVAVECFVDELAAAAGRDPAEYRLTLLQRAGADRHAAVLRRVLAEAGDAPAAARQGPTNGTQSGRGYAVHASFGSFVAMSVDVTLAQPDARPRVDRVHAAVDCGYAVHPDGVMAQIEGAVAFALSAVFYGDVRFEQGQAQAHNFDDQPLLRIDDMPEVHVHLISPETPPAELGGVGEIGVPPVAPAVLNALHAATGQRRRALPL